MKIKYLIILIVFLIRNKSLKDYYINVRKNNRRLSFKISVYRRLMNLNPEQWIECPFIWSETALGHLHYSALYADWQRRF
jgi:hypothetical protein